MQPGMQLQDGLGLGTHHSAQQGHGGHETLTVDLPMRPASPLSTQRQGHSFAASRLDERVKHIPGPDLAICHGELSSSLLDAMEPSATAHQATG